MAYPPQGYSDPAARQQIEQLRKRLDELVDKKNPPPEAKCNLLYDSLILHPKIRSATESLFKTAHYASSIFEAYKVISNLVKKRSGIKNKDGQDLMAHVFNENKPILKLAPLDTTSGKDEQVGFKLVLMGVMTGIRNPKAHDIVVQKDPLRTLQYLAFADLLARRIDKAKKTN